MKCRLYKIPLNTQGYAPDGTYYGHNLPLWQIETVDGSSLVLDGVLRHYAHQFRAADREQAKAKALKMFPNQDVSIIELTSNPQ